MRVNVGLQGTFSQGQMHTWLTHCFPSIPAKVLACKEGALGEERWGREWWWLRTRMRTRMRIRKEDQGVGRLVGLCNRRGSERKEADPWGGAREVFAGRWSELFDFQGARFEYRQVRIRFDICIDESDCRILQSEMMMEMKSEMMMTTTTTTTTTTTITKMMMMMMMMMNEICDPYGEAVFRSTNFTTLATIKVKLSSRRKIVTKSV
eukprot:745897-Hanusia_phi.AAC.10